MRLIFASAIGLMILAGASAAQSAAPAEKTAGESMKNVVALKDVPASELGPAMAIIAGSLGVGCQDCHTQAFESDAKKEKLTARSMIKMTREINASNFGGRTVVTCNTCHQGSVHPKDMPNLFNKTPEQIAEYKKEQELAAARPKAPPAGPPRPAVEKPVEVLPTVDQVFANYRKAVGAAAVKSVHLVGTMSPDLAPSSRTLDTYAVLPDKFVMTISFSGIQSKAVLNGDRAWSVSPQGKVDVPPERVAQVKQVIVLFEPIKYASSDAPRKVTGIEKVGGRTCFIVESTTAKKLERLYFDTQTGLLHKVYTETRTALGREPSEVIFEDYRDANGVTMPASIIALAVTDRVVYKFSEMQTNVDVDPAKFEPPTAGK